MASEVSICNQALSWLGASRIISLDDGTTNAVLCKDNYAELRNAVLEEGKFTFATGRFSSSAPLADPPAYGYSKSFLISNLILIVIEVKENPLSPEGTSDLDWRREGNRILCNSDSIYYKAISVVEDPTKFNATFAQALAARIAAELSPVITGSNTKTNQMWGLYERKMNLALGIDGGQGRSDRVRSASGITRVR